jgi:hypothetical protein
MRGRIGALLEPEENARRRAARAAIDPEEVPDEVEGFVALVRSGAYMGRDRRVALRERTRWRFTFRRLAADAQAALRDEQSINRGALVDLTVVGSCCY